MLTVLTRVFNNGLLTRFDYLIPSSDLLYFCDEISCLRSPRAAKTRTIVLAISEYSYHSAMIKVTDVDSMWQDSRAVVYSHKQVDFMP